MSGPSTSGPRRRIVIDVLLVPVWAVIALISLDAFAKISQPANLLLLLLVVVFAGWSWWFGEHRAKLRQRSADSEHETP